MNRMKHDISRSHEIGFQQRRITHTDSHVKQGFGFFLFCFFYPSGRRSGFLACVKSNQQGKAVITNKLLLVNLCQTMWSDQCVARNKDNIITV